MFKWYKANNSWYDFNININIICKTYMGGGVNENTEGFKFAYTL